MIGFVSCAQETQFSSADDSPRNRKIAQAPANSADGLAAGAEKQPNSSSSWRQSNMSNEPRTPPIGLPQKLDLKKSDPANATTPVTPQQILKSENPFRFISKPEKKHLIASLDTILIQATMRDVREVSEPGGLRDFEETRGTRIAKGIVAPQLGEDQKPTPGPQAGQHLFDPAGLFKWYIDDPKVNHSFSVQLAMQRQAETEWFEYSNNAFFPLDGKGFNEGVDGRNFHFTTEMALDFNYDPKQRFYFTGDDDLWVFVNGVLALDIGGVHGARSDKFSMADFVTLHFPDTSPGQKMKMHIFHAERHRTQSNFSIRTNIIFKQKHYVYHAKTSGASGAVTYTLVEGPTGMRIARETGILEWNPSLTKTEEASYAVEVRATDSLGNTTTQKFAIDFKMITSAQDAFYITSG